ncbi:MAG: sulfatase-like hydrolase/transferase [Verrucomicrobiales bacterium]|nr:sulfatase-like hydrolase/transferase [Verrucomicrobiales bacterium]
MRIIYFLALLFLPSLNAATKPNIVYIMCDELGYFEPSFMGSKTISTPRIDRLAKEGMWFTQALAGSSVCAPTRCVLMTGKHSGHTSVRVNGGGTPLRAEEKTIANMLKAGGYATGGFGKWGCGGRGSTGVPEKHGFDVFLGYYDQVHAHSYYPPYIIKNSEEVALPGNKGGSTGTQYSHYIIFEESLKFIRTNKDKPFFCYLPITPPHGIFDIPDSDPAWADYKNKDWPEPARRYAAMVGMVDRQVGQVLDLLKELDLDKNTIVFFCGDNGGNNYFKTEKHPRGLHSANKNPKTGVEFRGGKGNLYEGGLRIPMAIRWPGNIKPGRVSDHLWYFPDVMPTLAEITGTHAVKDTDGISILPELLGRKQPQHKYLYWELGNQSAVRMGNWKAVRPRPNASWELYDLKTDISEEINVAAANPEVLSQIKAHATAAHEPAVVGTFADLANHEKDRRAKFGSTRPPQRPGKAKWITKGLLPNKNFKIVSASSENHGNGKFARNVIDGDANTIWHTQFSTEIKKHPHELIIDLGREHTLTGFRLLTRQDAGWNGTIKDIEITVSSHSENFGAPTLKTTLKKTKSPQDLKCAVVKGRFIRIRALSEINAGPWASLAEFGVKGK